MYNKIIQGFPNPQRNLYKVCVRTNTYNQSNFIELCLNGVVQQNTHFRYVYLIIDDCSTDGEQDVIRAFINTRCDMDTAEYYDNDICSITLATIKTNPNCLVVVYFLKQNLYTNPQKKSTLYESWREVCKYETLCEGDDYWIDSDILQKQSDFLDSHEQYSAIANNAKNISFDGKTLGLFSYKPSRDLSDMGEIVRQRQFHTAAIMYRLSSFNVSPARESNIAWDTFWWCCLMSQGPIRYEESISCVYRLGTGVTSTTPNMKWIMIQEQWENILYATFAPKYINYNDPYYSLLRDIMSVLVNKKCTKEEKAKLKNLFMRYITPSLFIELIPSMWINVKSIVKRLLNR